jgi:hypothetical protein
MTCKEVGEQACGTKWCVCNTGRMHNERRVAQQRAADKRRVRRKQDIDWKKEITE